MTGKINKNGFLSIIRAGKMNEQGCPFAQKEDAFTRCGAWCSAFDDSMKGKLYLNCFPQRGIISITADERGQG